MAKKIFVVRGLGPGLDGLLAEGGEVIENGEARPDDEENTDLVEILKLRNQNIVVGDRELSVALPKDSLYIRADHLTETDDPGIREYDHRNPFGKFSHSTTHQFGDLEVALTEHELATSVSVTQVMGKRKRTIYSQNFQDEEARDDVRSAVQEIVDSRERDADGLVFELQDIRETELAKGN